MHLREGVNGFLAVVRHVVYETADQRVGDQARGEDAAVNDLRPHDCLLSWTLLPRRCEICSLAH